MKCFRLTLSIGLHVYVVADRCVHEGRMICFYKGDGHVGSYPELSVVRMVEVELKSTRGQMGRGSDAAPP